MEAADRISGYFSEQVIQCSLGVVMELPEDRPVRTGLPYLAGLFRSSGGNWVCPFATQSFSSFSADSLNSSEVIELGAECAADLLVGSLLVSAGIEHPHLCRFCRPQ